MRFIVTHVFEVEAESQSEALNVDPGKPILRSARPKKDSGERHKSKIIHGAGTQLKKLISKFGFKPSVGCKCEQHIQEMNLKGVEWCSQNVDTIAGWLREEADRAGYPFTEIGAKILIRRAIKNAIKAGVRNHPSPSRAQAPARSAAQ